MDGVLGAGTTGSDGRFAVACSSSASRLILLAKLKGKSIGLQHRLLELPQREEVVIEFDSQRGFHSLEGEIESTAGLPDYLDVFLNPLSFDGVPDGLRRFFYQKRPGVVDAHFTKTPVRGSTFTFKLQPGTYRMGGEHMNYDRLEAVHSEYRNYVVKAATLIPSNTPLPGDETLGFTLRADQDRRVVLWLRVVEDTELAG
jgi:hypothetical protein